jgi:hypothetical protein
MHVEPLNKIMQPKALHILETDIKFKEKLGTYKTSCKTSSLENLMVSEILAIEH